MNVIRIWDVLRNWASVSESKNMTVILERKLLSEIPTFTVYSFALSFAIDYASSPQVNMSSIFIKKIESLCIHMKFKIIRNYG